MSKELERLAAQVEARAVDYEQARQEQYDSERRNEHSNSGLRAMYTDKAEEAREIAKMIRDLAVDRPRAAGRERSERVKIHTIWTELSDGPVLLACETTEVEIARREAMLGPCAGETRRLTIEIPDSAVEDLFRVPVVEGKPLEPEEKV